MNQSSATSKWNKWIRFTKKLKQLYKLHCIRKALRLPSMKQRNILKIGEKLGRKKMNNKCAYKGNDGACTEKVHKDGFCKRHALAFNGNYKKLLQYHADNGLPNGA